MGLQFHAVREHCSQIIQNSNNAKDTPLDGYELRVLTQIKERNERKTLTSHGPRTKAALISLLRYLPLRTKSLEPDYVDFLAAQYPEVLYEYCVIHSTKAPPPPLKMSGSRGKVSQQNSLTQITARFNLQLQNPKFLEGLLAYYALQAEINKSEGKKVSSVASSDGKPVNFFGVLLSALPPRTAQKYIERNRIDQTRLANKSPFFNKVLKSFISAFFGYGKLYQWTFGSTNSTLAMELTSLISPVGAVSREAAIGMLGKPAPATTPSVASSATSAERPASPTSTATPTSASRSASPALTDSAASLTPVSRPASPTGTVATATPAGRAPLPTPTAAAVLTTPPRRSVSPASTVAASSATSVDRSASPARIDPEASATAADGPASSTSRKRASTTVEVAFVGGLPRTKSESSLTAIFPAAVDSAASATPQSPAASAASSELVSLAASPAADDPSVQRLQPRTLYTNIGSPATPVKGIFSPPPTSFSPVPASPQRKPRGNSLDFLAGSPPVRQRDFSPARTEEETLAVHSPAAGSHIIPAATVTYELIIPASDQDEEAAPSLRANP